MKKILLGFFFLCIIVIGLLVAIPFIYKDEIFKKLNVEIQKNINADVSITSDNLNLSLITSFPHIKATLNDFSITNRHPFEGKKLLDTQVFEVEIDLLSIIKGDIVISSIYLKNPIINILVDKTGQANYDLTYKTINDSSFSQQKVDKTKPKDLNATSNDLQIKIDKWLIENAQISYADKSTKMVMQLKNITHHGNGNFGMSVFDVSTNTEIEESFFSMDNEELLGGKKIDLNMKLEVNLNQMSFDIKENFLKVNEFSIILAGNVKLPVNTDNTDSSSKSSANSNDSIMMDIRFATPSQNIKPMLSLLPEVYAKDFSDIKTDGKLALKGLLKGKYDENVLPSILLNLKIEKGKIAYQSLPKSIDKMDVDLHIEMIEMLPHRTKIRVKKFNMNIGEQPISGKLYIENLDNPYLDANVSGKLDFTELTQIIPLDSLTLKGNLEFDAKIKGKYDSLSHIYPKVNIDFKYKNGLIKHDTLSYPIENINFIGKATNTTGLMKDMVVNIPNFGMKIQNDTIEGRLKFWNLDNYHWDMDVNGKFNLSTLTSIVPLEDMKVQGDMDIKLKAKGNMKDLELKKYHAIINQGNLKLKGFLFESKDMPQHIKMDASVSFTPQGMNIDQASGSLGTSPFQVSGFVGNYLPYVLDDNAILKSKIEFKSSHFNLNEWMDSEDEESSDSNDDKKENKDVKDKPTTSFEEETAFLLPKNIDFTLKNSINKMQYSDIELTDFYGEVILKDEKLEMNNLKLNMLEGNLYLNGVYSTKKPSNPNFNFKFKAKDISAKSAYEKIKIVEKYMPIASSIRGNFDSNFSMRGDILPDMTPDMNSIMGNGDVFLTNVSFDKNARLVKVMNEKLAFLKNKELRMKDMHVQMEIKDGKLIVKPFNVNISGYKAVVYGTNSITGTIDYTADMDVPMKVLSSTNTGVNLSGLSSFLSNQSVILPVRFTGTYDKFSCTLGQPKLGKYAKKEAKKQLKQEGKKQIKQILKKTGITNKDSLNKIINSKDLNKEVNKKADQLKKVFGF